MIRCVVALVCVITLSVALPQGVAAQAGEEEGASAAPAVHSKYHLPPQLMLRASYFPYLDADTAADATSDPTEASAEEPMKPASEPVLKLELDSGGLKVTPTAPGQTRETTPRGRGAKPGAKAGIAVGVILGAGLVVGGAVAATLASWSRSYD